MLSAEQMARLLEGIDLEEKAGASSLACDAIRVAFWTGWRIGEVLTLEWNNLDLERGLARLLKTRSSDEEYRQMPKPATFWRMRSCWQELDIESAVTVGRFPVLTSLGRRLEGS